MTYNVFSGTLNPTQSVNQSVNLTSSFVTMSWYVIFKEKLVYRNYWNLISVEMWWTIANCTLCCSQCIECR